MDEKRVLKATKDRRWLRRCAADDEMCDEMVRVDVVEEAGNAQTIRAGTWSR